LNEIDEAFEKNLDVVGGLFCVVVVLVTVIVVVIVAGEALSVEDVEAVVVLLQTDNWQFKILDTALSSGYFPFKTNLM
jgi:uncharacterized membrane protein HdeD (DUF308 family)